MIAEIERYLQGPEAVRDVAAQLAWPARPPTPSVGTWVIDSRQAWTRIRVILPAQITDETYVFFRKDGDCYIVTDLGEALHAYRLRTGYAGPITDAIRTPAITWGDIHTGMRVDSGMVVCGHKDSDGSPLVPAADLSAAICRVLLAAWRVSQMELPT